MQENDQTIPLSFNNICRLACLQMHRHQRTDNVLLLLFQDQPIVEGVVIPRHGFGSVYRESTCKG